MSIEQFKALGRSLPKYREWRAAQIAARKRRAQTGETLRVIEVPTPHDELEIPKFLAPDPLEIFIESERKGDETDPETLARLRAELEVHFANGKNSALSIEDEARFRYLTSNLKPGIA